MLAAFNCRTTDGLHAMALKLAFERLLSMSVDGLGEDGLSVVRVGVNIGIGLMCIM
jgi:hypothetical protein